jgi:hypothetical protein
MSDPKDTSKTGHAEPADSGAPTPEKTKAGSAPPAEHEAAPPPPPPPPALKSEDAMQLFAGGHKLAQVGHAPEEWISMTTARYKGAVVQCMIKPLSPAFEEIFKKTEWYVVEE